MYILKWVLIGCGFYRKPQVVAQGTAVFCVIAIALFTRGNCLDLAHSGHNNTDHLKHAVLKHDCPPLVSAARSHTTPNMIQT